VKLRILIPAILVLPVLLCASVSAKDRSAYSPGDHQLQLKVGGYARTAVLHVPAAYRRSAPPPLVIGLHGAGGNGADFLAGDGWSELSEREGFLVVAPDGLPARPDYPSNLVLNPRLWNSGQLEASGPRAKIDDVAFIRALMKLIARKVPYDARRVYVTGHSMGGGMTFRLARAMGDRITAIGTVAGIASDEAPPLPRPVPTLFIYGELDPLMPLEGGRSRTPWGSRTTLPVPQYVSRWATALDCDSTPNVTRDDGQLRIAEFRTAQGEMRLRWITIKGQGHAWPGGQSHKLLRRWLGPETNNLDATAAIWQFFATATPLPIAPASGGE